MPHQRPRELLTLIEKRLSHFPIVGVLGARQTGKSTLLRELLEERRTIRYVTLDREESRALAAKRPSLFIEKLESPEIQTVCIDEIQKVPTLFDTLKAEVDERKRPGRFAISGSTEFSRKTGIQESLTGRIALLRLYPLNLSEIFPGKATHPLTRANRSGSAEKHGAKAVVPLKGVEHWMERGGMPGIFAIREDAAREATFENWLETTCTRDLAQFAIPRFNPELARRIWLAISRAETPNRTEIARAVGKTPRQIERYFDAFKSLFVLYEVEPHTQSVGKSLFFPFDAGIAGFSGASEQRRRQIWFLNECYSQYMNAGLMRPDIRHYETTRGSRVDFIVDAREGSFAVKLTGEEAPSTYTLRSVEALALKNPELPILVLAPCKSTHLLEGKIRIVPWNQVV